MIDDSEYTLTPPPSCPTSLDHLRIRQFAEVGLHLIAVWSSANGSKGKRDPADWLPPNRAYWCTYLNDWIAIKRDWELSMDQAEADTIRKGLGVCSEYEKRDHIDGRHEQE